MGLFSGGRQERDAFPYPDIPPNSMAGGLGIGTSFVNPASGGPESALRKVAVFASANLIAGVSSSLPLDGFTGSGLTKRDVNLPAFFDDPDGSGQGIEDWLYQLFWSWLLRGNAIGLI